MSTIPTRTGTVVLELDGESFDLEIDICDLDEDGLEFLAYDEEREPPVRVEYSTNTGGRLVVAIDAADVLDPGVESWTGEPELGLTSESAVASDIEMTDLDGSSVEASLEVSCPELE